MKRKIVIGWLIVVGIVAMAAGSTVAAERTVPPDVIIDYSPAESGRYIGSPSIAVLPDGDYVASHDFFGPGTRMNEAALTAVFRSQNRGQTWQQVGLIEGQFWSSLFVHDGALYIIGCHHQYGPAIIRKSTDGGETWTEPKDAKSGLLVDGHCHTAPVPIVEHEGRLWRAFEDRHPNKGWGTNFRSFVISAPADADLLDASNWRVSNRLRSDQSWLDGRWTGWLEGNVVVTPEDDLVNILRVACKDWKKQKAAIARISDDGRKQTFNPDEDIINMPGGMTKFTIRYDEETGRYWSLVNKMKSGVYARNQLALASSKDLRNWRVHKVLLSHPDREHHAWQYVHWLFDGDDIIAVSRTAWDGSHNWHDANYMTFHRIKNWRSVAGVE